MDSTNFILIRHGETEWNRKRLIQGHSDSPLTELGRKQARAVGSALEGEVIDLLVSSEAGRAMETARLIGERVGLSPTAIPDIHERGFGELEGMTIAEAGKRFGDDVPYRMYHEPEFSDFGIESQTAFRDRIVAAIDKLAIQHAGKTILTVTHGGSLSSVFKHTIGLDLGAPRRYELTNCSINQVKIYQGEWTISTWGYSNHLKQASLDETTA